MHPCFRDIWKTSALFYGIFPSTQLLCTRKDMLKKLISGVVFGSGFAIAFISIMYFSSFISFEHKTYSTDQISDSNTKSTPFHELDIEEQIKQSSVIALARYEKNKNGEMKTIITEILKKDSDTKFYYNIGDEYSSFPPKTNTFYGNGEVIFFIGSPATIKRSVSYYGDRIHGLGDIPVGLFRKICNEKNA